MVDDGHAKSGFWIIGERQAKAVPGHFKPERLCGDQEGWQEAAAGRRDRAGAGGRVGGIAQQNAEALAVDGPDQNV